MLNKIKRKIKFVSFRFGTITGISKGMRFHTAVNKFCLDASLNRGITIYKTSYNQIRPYLSVRDAFKVFKFCIEKNFYNNETYNALSGNYSVGQIIAKIKRYKKKIKIKYISSPIMNKINFIVSTKKLKNAGLNLNSEIITDIKNTINLFKNIKNEIQITNKAIEPFMTFGKMPIANGFIEKENFDKEFFFEMEVGFSNELSLFQLNDHPKPELMFNEKYPFFTGSSEYMKEHFRKFSEYLKNNYLGSNSKLIEIGSNEEHY